MAAAQADAVPAVAEEAQAGMAAEEEERVPAVAEEALQYSVMEL